MTVTFLNFKNVRLRDPSVEKDFTPLKGLGNFGERERMSNTHFCDANLEDKAKHKHLPLRR